MPTAGEGARRRRKSFPIPLEPEINDRNGKEVQRNVPVMHESTECRGCLWAVDQQGRRAWLWQTGYDSILR